uniref:Matrix metallopeptidase 27 n=1 Tax=Salvator merianae TaxID=96440 RepID=A0A8D0C4N4_SALMN
SFRMLCLLLLLSCFSSSFGFPLYLGERNEEEDMKLKYLNQFYEQDHEPGQRGWRSNNSSFADKIQQMQQFFGLNVTGKVDTDTLEVMQQPRCGVPDIGQYVLALPGWEKNRLTYRIVNYTPDMKKTEVDASIQKAFEVWSAVTPLTFSKVHNGRADIMIDVWIIIFIYLHTGCPRYFDGPLGVLGHAFPPGHPLRGTLHFDEDENWTTKFNLFLVAAHEIGHILGLAHSGNPTALMYPSYKLIDPIDFPLSQDDIAGIQAIYGPSLNPPKIPVKPTLPKRCDPKITFDAITTLRREIIFLKGRHLWRVYPHRSGMDFEVISSIWPFLPLNIQAVYENTNDQLLFFKDNHFWVTSGFWMQPGYPKTIDSFGFPRTIQKIDTAVCDKNTGKTYFFVGNKYWRYDEKNQTMDKSYPRKIKDDFPEVGPKIDAVFQHKGFFYFFRGTKQWKFDLKARKAVCLMKSNSWLNC